MGPSADLEIERKFLVAALPGDLAPERADLIEQGYLAVAPDGAIASFCTLWYDDVTRAVCFEPVGTSPEHQRRGLAKAVIAEGMRRAKEMGALVANFQSWLPSAGERASLSNRKVRSSCTQSR